MADKPVVFNYANYKRSIERIKELKDIIDRQTTELYRLRAENNELKNRLNDIRNRLEAENVRND